MQADRAQKIMRDTVAQYNRIASAFDSTRASSADLTPLRSFVKDGNLVLDAGCGNGRLTQVMRGAQVHMIGCDASSELIACAQKRYEADIRAGWLGFTIADITDLPFDAHQFDVVFVLAVLHHVPSEALRMRVMRSLMHITKKGGLCVGTVWNVRGTHTRTRFALDAQLHTPASGNDAGDVYVPWRANGAHEDRYCHAFTRDELRVLCEGAGWRVVQLDPVTKSFAPAPERDAENLFFVLGT